ncbi:MAG: LiaF transmembrane domain-containing protein [Mucilaginibacter sp.]
MSIDIENPSQPQPVPQPPRNNGKVIGGAILLVIGIIFLLQQLDIASFADWVMSWPMWLIAWGIFVGARGNFRNSTWLIMVLIGMAFLTERIFPGFDVWNFAWPIGIIVLGCWLIIRRNQPWDEEKWKRKWERKNNKWGQKWDKYEYKYDYKYGKWGAAEPVTPVTPANPENPVDPNAPTATMPSSPGGSSQTHSGDDVLDTVSVFGNIVKTVFSKNFRGGDVVNIFGGTELDLTQADINGRVIIDIVQIFGGSKIIVPSNWQVVSDTAAVFAGIDDKRIKAGVIQDPNKILVIKGVSIFAGIDIRSY